MNAVDLMLIAALVFSMVLGAWRGFLYEVLLIAGWVAAFWAAQAFAADAARHLPMGGASETLKFAAGFVVVFVVSAFVAGVLAWAIRKVAEKAGLRPVDRVLGSLFGLLRALVLLVAAAMLVGLTPLAQHDEWTSSAGAQALSMVARDAKAWLPDDLKKVLP